MKRFLLLTDRERIGTTDGLNLFFGALLGANLGTLSSISLMEYSQFILLLAGTVMALRMISSTERRVYALGMLAVFAGFIALFWTVPDLKPEGLAEGDMKRILLTIAIWIGAVSMQELMPVLAPEEAINAKPEDAGNEGLIAEPNAALILPDHEAAK
jgi:hypothetical protein